MEEIDVRMRSEVRRTGYEYRGVKGKGRECVKTREVRTRTGKQITESKAVRG